MNSSTSCNRSIWGTTSTSRGWSMPRSRSSSGSSGTSRSNRKSPRPHHQALRPASDEPLLVVDPRLGEPARVGSEQRLRLDADPLALGLVQQVDGEVGVDEQVLAKIEDGADAV